MEMSKPAIRLPQNVFEGTQKRSQCSMCASLFCFSSMTKKSCSGIWESRFRACYAFFILSGVTVPGLHCETAFSSALCCFQEQVPELGLESRRRRKVRREEAGVAIPPSPPLQTSAQRGIQAPVHPTSLQIPEALKLWTKSLQASSIFSGESKRDVQKGWIIPQGLF